MNSAMRSYDSTFNLLNLAMAAMLAFLAVRTLISRQTIDPETEYDFRSHDLFLSFKITRAY